VKQPRMTAASSDLGLLKERMKILRSDLRAVSAAEASRKAACRLGMDFRKSSRRRGHVRIRKCGEGATAGREATSASGEKGGTRLENRPRCVDVLLPQALERPSRST
jgi:hypothetical protein